MLQKSETNRWAVVKYGFVAMLTLSLFVFVAACEDRAKQDVINDKEITVSGQIFSSDGTPLPGANIVLQNVERGTTTDANGRYQINVPANGVLLIGFVGHRSQKIVVDGHTTIDAKLVLGPDDKLTTVLGDVAKSGSRIDVQSADDGKGEIFTVVETLPEFPGGMRALTDFMAKNVRYPEAAQKANVSGRVFLRFVINTDGSFQDIQILKGIGYGADAEAVRVIKAMPRWKPGMQNGHKVRVQYNLPINFPTKR